MGSWALKAIRFLERWHVYVLIGVYAYSTFVFFSSLGLRGICPLFVNCVLPPLLAIIVSSSPTASLWDRRLAGAFLWSLAASVTLAPIDMLFTWMPQQVNTVAARITMFSTGIYVFFLLLVLPPYVFGKALMAHRRGLPGSFAAGTCQLGLFTWAFLMFGLLGTLVKVIATGRLE